MKIQVVEVVCSNQDAASVVIGWLAQTVEADEDSVTFVGGTAYVSGEGLATWAERVDGPALENVCDGVADAVNLQLGFSEAGVTTGEAAFDLPPPSWQDFVAFFARQGICVHCRMGESKPSAARPRRTRFASRGHAMRTARCPRL